MPAYMKCGCYAPKMYVDVVFCPLHAAAPDLLEACKAAQSVLNDYIEGRAPKYHPGLADQKLYDAIRKAEGAKLSA